MGFPSSLSSYPDVEALFDKALESEKGLRLTFESSEQAIFNAGRMNAYRVRLRRENSRVYPADHALFGKTPYDGLMVKVRGDIVEIEKLAVSRFNIEELP